MHILEIIFEIILIFVIVSGDIIYSVINALNIGFYKIGKRILSKKNRDIYDFN